MGTGEFNARGSFAIQVSHPGWSRNTPSRFMPQTPVTSAGLMGRLARVQTLPLWCSQTIEKCRSFQTSAAVMPWLAFALKKEFQNRENDAADIWTNPWDELTKVTELTIQSWNFKLNGYVKFPKASVSGSSLRRHAVV